MKIRKSTCEKLINSLSLFFIAGFLVMLPGCGKSVKSQAENYIKGDVDKNVILSALELKEAGKDKDPMGGTIYQFNFKAMLTSKVDLFSSDGRGTDCNSYMGESSVLFVTRATKAGDKAAVAGDVTWRIDSGGHVGKVRVSGMYPAPFRGNPMDDFREGVLGGGAKKIIIRESQEEKDFIEGRKKMLADTERLLVGTWDAKVQTIYGKEIPVVIIFRKDGTYTIGQDSGRWNMSNGRFVEHTAKGSYEFNIISISDKWYCMQQVSGSNRVTVRATRSPDAQAK